MLSSPTECCAVHYTGVGWIFTLVIPVASAVVTMSPGAVVTVSPGAVIPVAGAVVTMSPGAVVTMAGDVVKTRRGRPR